MYIKINFIVEWFENAGKYKPYKINPTLSNNREKISLLVARTHLLELTLSPTQQLLPCSGAAISPPYHGEICTRSRPHFLLIPYAFKTTIVSTILLHQTV